MAEIGAAGKEKQLNGDFRLWLTAEPDDQLPVVFLQSCLKATYETPPGIRKNLERNYITQIGSIGEAERNVPKLRAQFLLHWLHAVAQERRNFIPQAWLRFFQFQFFKYKNFYN
jgi:dynein heavy chain 2